MMDPAEKLLRDIFEAPEPEEHTHEAITDNPEEWEYVGPFWQNNRVHEAFSMNGGVTYYLQCENSGKGTEGLIFHASTHIEKEK